MKVTIELDTNDKKELQLIIDLCAEFINEKKSDILDNKIEFLEFSIRINNCLKEEGINTIKDLIKWSEIELLKTKFLGKRALNEIKNTLKEYNLELYSEHS